MRAAAGALALAALLLATACTRVGSVPDPAPAGGGGGTSAGVTPRVEPPSRSGNMVEYVQSGRRYRVMETSRDYEQEGIASWYGARFQGRSTSSGERYDMNRMTAAHRTLPLPTYVEVTNLANGRSVILRVNDRGPFHDPDRRIIDVSRAAAAELGMLATGTAPVRVRALEPWQTRTGL